jgi:hypothetical protein
MEFEKAERLRVISLILSRPWNKRYWNHIDSEEKYIETKKLDLKDTGRQQEIIMLQCAMTIGELEDLIYEGFGQNDLQWIGNFHVQLPKESYIIVYFY